MANPFGEEELSEDEQSDHGHGSRSEDGERIMEGFLCPNCIAKFNTTEELIIHFEDNHKGETPQKITSSLKEILGKAKKIFESDDDPQSASAPSKQNSLLNDQFGGIDVDEYFKINQTVGPVRNHWPLFKQKRDARIGNCISETNKLLIRLDKLLREAPQGKFSHVPVYFEP